MASASKTVSESPSILVSSAFDTGNIEVDSIDSSSETNETRINLRIRSDPFTKTTDNKAHKQWFHFKVSNLKTHASETKASVVVCLKNAGTCSYPDAFHGYWVCGSSEPGYEAKWARFPTTFDGKCLTFRVPDDAPNTMWFAYFTPYTLQDHQQLIGRCQRNPLLISARSIGHSSEGRDIDLLRIGDGKQKVWLIGRQHPGETQPSFWMEGLLKRLLDPTDPVASNMRRACSFFIVPLMCPDGACRGHLRTNATGSNLNREWAPSVGKNEKGESVTYDAPTIERSPEVLFVLREMDKSGCDMFLDVHGDEELPHVFLAGGQGTKVWGPRLEMLFAALATNYSKANCDFGDLKFGYGNDKTGEARLNIASSQITQRFDCLAATLEMPYKDCYAWPDPACGMTATRCARLGESFLDALAPLVPILRVAESDVRSSTGFAKGTPEWAREGYVSPKHEEVKWRST